MIYPIQEKQMGAGGRIGLLGGSFDPAHEGHHHISEVALKRLQLDSVWWLVSPQNPLKKNRPAASLEHRLHTARTIAHHPRLHVTDVETRLGISYTIETIRYLQARYPDTKFIWLMGADNFIQLPQWKHWTEIMAALPVAVIARPRYHLSAGLSKAACRYQNYRHNPEQAALLPAARPPAWTLILDQLHPASSTQLRAGYSR
jgi:nicotinate-nucleotide adenylyltransferase